MLDTLPQIQRATADTKETKRAPVSCLSGSLSGRELLLFQEQLAQGHQHVSRLFGFEADLAGLEIQPEPRSRPPHLRLTCSARRRRRLHLSSRLTTLCNRFASQQSVCRAFLTFATRWDRLSRSSASIATRCNSMKTPSG